MAGIVPIPNRPINFVEAKAGETFKLGTLTIRIMEDGSRTDNRIGSAELIVPANTPGPPAHWHQMHDETFLVTKGTIRFHVPDPENPGQDLKTIDAHEGDYVTVPTHAPHTFSNPTDGESRFFNTYTPAYYINYFKLLSSLAVEGQPMPAEANMTAMALFATLPVYKPKQSKD